MKVGMVSNYYKHVKVAAIKLTKPLNLGDKIQIKGGNAEFEQIINSMQINKKSVNKAKSGDEVGIIVSQKVRKGYEVFKK